MTPLPNQAEGTPKFRYNEALCKARNPVERLFGVLKGTWRCLSKQRTLLYDPEFAGKIVNACAVLHNFVVGNQTNESHDTSMLAEPQTDSTYLNVHVPTSTAKRVQDRLITNFFT